MSEQPFQRLAWQNRWVRYIQQPLEGADCFQESVLLNPENNIMVLNLSEFEFTRLFSAIMTGAEISYPDESHQVMVDFLKGIQCPPTLVAEECFNLPTYANNIKYTPANPYIEPNEIPDGYLTQPFLVNGQNGNDFTGYEPFDVIVPFDAITFDIDFFDEISGQLPTVEIMVQGTGSVNIRLLTTVQGGLVVITLDNPPNLLDILSGIVTGAENIVDVNQDLVSLPPETAKEIIFPVNIDTTGIHTIYAVFLPILDDSLIPIRFGGGFRGIEICGFLPEGDMGLQNLRFLNCNLEQQNQDGSWVVVDGWEDWLDCVPSGGGGSGAGTLKVTTVNSAETSAKSGTNTAYNGGVNRDYIHNFTKSKALIQYTFAGANAASGETSSFKVGLAGMTPVSFNEAKSNGVTAREYTVQAVYEDIPAGNRQSWVEGMTTAGGTWQIAVNFVATILIIEFEDASDLYVTSVRIQGNELQYQIAGAWITASDSLAAILASITAIANNAAAAAAAAQSTANNALTVANGAVTVNNTQNTRLNNIEDDIEDIELSISQINITLADHEARIDALEAALGTESKWGDFHLGSVQHLGSNLNPALGVYTVNVGAYAAASPGRSAGFTPSAGGVVDVSAEDAMRYGSCVVVGVQLNEYTSGGSSEYFVSINNSDEVEALVIASTGRIAWLVVHPNVGLGGQPLEFMHIEVREEHSGVASEWRVVAINYLCTQINPFTGALFP